MIDRERNVLIKSFTDTLLEYKEEKRTLEEHCKELEGQLNGVLIGKGLKIKSLEERCKYLEEQLNKKGSENMLYVLSEKNSEINKLTDRCIEKSSEIKKLTERCKELEEQLNRKGTE